ncbi:MAG: hypothetical protein LBC55_09080 [Desulfovibrio sp.]|nr:hypothetical protein [Desulfovibrio sp.]
MSGLSSTLQTVLAVQNALIGQLLEQGGGTSLIEHMFEQKRKSGREIMAEALTGSMRADAGMYRQAARNAMEGKSIADILHTATQSMQQSLDTMITALNNPDFLTNTDVQKTYNNARANLLNITDNTIYNNIKLLDGSVPEIDLHIGKTDKKISLDDLKIKFSEYPDAGDIKANITLNPDIVQDTLVTLNTMQSTLKLKDSSWQAMGAGFKTSAEALERQAKIYDLTAARSILGARADPSDRLLNALLADQGRIMNFLT